MLLLMFACAKSDESKTSETETSNSNTLAPSSVSRTSDLSIGSKECPYGGLKIETGIDENMNGVLDDNEVDNIGYVCNGTPGSSSDNISIKSMNGFVQKGPFIQGTEITVRELFPYNSDNGSYSIIYTGKTFTGVIEDDLGTFKIKGLIGNNIVELSALGYYFNEISGSLSTSPISMQALADLTDASSINVNLMTHLEKKRVEYLIDKGVSFTEAKVQAQGEILKMFNLDNISIGNSETLDISKSGTGNAVLLAISALLQSNRTEAEMTELLSIINTDLRLDGTLDSESTKGKLLESMEFLKPIRSQIRNNIKSRYNNLGLIASIPAFESYAFKLDTVIPTIESINYTYGAKTLVSSLKIVFSDIMDNTSLSNDTFYIEDTSGNRIQGEITSTESSTFSSVTFTPSGDMSLSDNYTATITTGAKDLNGNQLKENQSWSFMNRSDTTPPVIAESQSIGNPTNDSTPSYNFTSNEAGTLIFGGSCTSSTTTAVSGNNVISFDNLSEGIYSDCTVRIRDEGQNLSNLLSVTPFSVDVTRPSITITATEGIDGFTSSNSQLSLTFTTSENTDNFEVSDVSVSNGSLSDFTGSNKSYTATLTPSGQGEVKINVAEGKFTDNATNNNTASTEFNWIYDTTNPTITITASQGSDGFTSNDPTLSLTFTSTKATLNFDENDISVTNGILSSFTASSSTTYTAIFTPTTDGAVTIDVGANKFTGPAGNINTASIQFNWTYDSTGPTVSSTSPSNSGTEIIAQNSTISVTFSEAMSTSTITTNTSNTSCSGSIQVSSDDFSSCIQMSSAPVASNSNKTFTVSPSSMLASNTTFKIRLSTSVKDSVGNPLSSQYTQDNGFTTETFFTKTGSISSNETWSKSSGNYYVTGNLLVANGVTVTIDAGTSIKFASGTYLKVEGFLVAQGTSGNLINIIADNDSTSKNHWLGIYIRPTGKTTYDSNMNYSSGSILKYVKVSNSERGIYAYDTSLLIEYSDFDKNIKGVEIRRTDNFTIRNSTFTNNDYGIWSEYQVYGDDPYGEIKDTFISSNTFSNNNYGIDLNMNQADFNNLHIDNNIINNNSIGIDFSGGGYGARVHSVYIYNNYFDNNSTYGLSMGQIYGIGTGTTENYPIQFFRNILNNNGINWNFGGGVSGVTSKITNNIIHNFSGDGIVFSGGTGRSDNVSYNLIQSNNKSIYLQDSYTDPSNMTFSYNTFTGSPSSELITTFGSGHKFNYNNFRNVSNYVIKNSSASSVDAENNYWGTTSTSEIASNIYDQSDNFELGAVDYSPYSNSLITTAPISPPTNTSASAGSSSFTLSWSANSESDLTGYKVYWDTDSGHPYANAQDVGNLTSKTITGLSSGTTYYVTVTAYDSTYNSANDNSSTIINENQTAGNESWYATEQSITTN